MKAPRNVALLATRRLWVTSCKVTEAGGRWAIYADADGLGRLRRLRNSQRGWSQPYPTELITPKKNSITGTASNASLVKVLS